MKRITTLLRPISGAVLLLISGWTSAWSQQAADDLPYFYAIGDMPYAQDEVEQYKTLIRYLNRTTPLFTIHVGDTKSGHVDCSDQSYAESRDVFNSFERPLIYTPGDNEWTDCHTKDCGEYLTTERLAYLRKILYATPFESLGKTRIRLDNQSRMPGFQKFVENSAWQEQDVMFCTVHICGSSNNYYSKAGKEEFTEREKADLAWLDEVFRRATASSLKGVVVAFHANIFQEKKSDGYGNLLKAFQRHAKAFGKPVLAIYGDTHTYDISKPLHNDGLLRNFTALQVFGSPDIYAVRVFIDDQSPELFKVEPVYPE